MPRDTAKPTRQEISDKRDAHSETMREIREKLERDARDITTVRTLDEELILDGATEEGTQEIKDSVDRAEGAAEGQFDEDDVQLEEAHQDTEDFRSDITERRDVSEENRERITDITDSLEIKEAIERIQEAKEGVLRELEFLEDIEKQALESLEESKDVRRQLEQIRRNGG